MFIWLIVIVVVVLLVVGMFNGLVRARNLVKNSFADIDVQLKRRYDLVPNLVETVKGYMKQESGVLEAVTNARAQAQSAGGNLANRATAENNLGHAITGIFAVAENYPQLRSSENFQQLQSQLSSLENDIQSARRYYNAAVREYNNKIQVFPNNIFAGMLGFGAEQPFGADETERQNVQVKF
ncbi:MAG: hypothetical protein JWO40_545 [Candidatus Doudnabacteria bacterium]|nr:hypothetical protein [Candidatus Doudnabacteria bacterium]